jgi:anti-sigma B factor antagonist
MEATLTIVALDAPVRGLRLIGELDIATVPSLTEALASLSGDGPVTLDLSELTFMDSSGIHAILQFASSLDGEGPLTLAHPSENVSRLLEIVALDTHPGIRIS